MHDVLRGGPSSAPAPIGLSIAQARLTRGGSRLFDGLDLTLEPAAITSLLGPSGVGKTTLLRLLAGLDTPEPPTIIAPSDGAPLAGRVAYMAQQDLLLPWLALVDNVMLGARLRREPLTAIVRDRARGLLAAVGLAGRERDRPASLSGGERQRVALARTLMEDRPVVLMDEPFSALDAITRLRLQDLAGTMLAGRTVLLVTHDPLEALRLSHRVHVMSGRPAAIGPALEPPGPPPRDPAAVMALHAEVLRRLAA